MNVESTLVDEFINGRDITCHKDDWFFSSSILDVDRGKNIFTLPSLDKIAAVRAMSGHFHSVLDSFVPVNKPLLDSLFPLWEKRDVYVDLIIGFPEPYDAVTLTSPDGNVHLVFDLGCWIRYSSFPNIEGNIRNVLTHELTHFLIGCAYRDVDEALKSKDYLTKLDANTFHEGFAHLISYESKSIEDVDWHCDRLKAVYAASKENMRMALKEKDRAKQEKYLYSAICGSYLDKWACMCGMLYLAGEWEKNGVEGLQRAFSSYHGFALKTLDGTI